MLSLPCRSKCITQMHASASCCTLRESDSVLNIDFLQMHIVKNWLVDNGWLDNSIRVPLILGIWGGKGQGRPKHLKAIS